jgi:hypothetical protein
MQAASSKCIFLFSFEEWTIFYLLWWLMILALCSYHELLARCVAGSGVLSYEYSAFYTTNLNGGVAVFLYKHEIPTFSLNLIRWSTVPVLTHLSSDILCSLLLAYFPLTGILYSYSKTVHSCNLISSGKVQIIFHLVPHRLVLVDFLPWKHRALS